MPSGIGARVLPRIAAGDSGRFKIIKDWDCQRLAVSLRRRVPDGREYLEVICRSVIV